MTVEESERSRNWDLKRKRIGLAITQRQSWYMRREERVNERDGSEKGEVEVTPQSGQRAPNLESTGQLEWAGGE
ncbi:uncharacterized protein N7496_012277 [Penicillium cataractarum]|uniref:Uncharacterized protein n=1 Tax=Penicillium cataractarum TaxID=2100454 RepID=A0A9W9R8R7_9EURO|nr:uncharacterized protein N7496_012277 [Penicillium cataractarum]KAJ5355065.1 hypothetical protein N7496_012277 [Penicillium cataractarum]